MAVVRPADLKYYTKTRDFTDVHVLGLRAAYEHQVRSRCSSLQHVTPEDAGVACTS